VRERWRANICLPDHNRPWTDEAAVGIGGALPSALK
jgi:hypothetical protein